MFGINSTTVVNQIFGAGEYSLACAVSAVASGENPIAAAVANAVGFVAGDCIEAVGQAYGVDKNTVILVAFGGFLFASAAATKLVDREYTVVGHFKNLFIGGLALSILRSNLKK